MATYRQIHITYWQDPFVEDLKPLHKYFYLYLLTNSKTTQCGCYEISDKLIKYETGLEQKQIDEMLKHFADSKRIVFNKPNNEILLLNWLKHNSFKSPKVKACIEKELISIKTSDFKQFIHGIINNKTSIDRLSIDYGYTMHTQSQEEEEEEEEEEEQEEKKNNGRFTPPTENEISDYCLERDNNVSASKFYDFYESKGWMVGKNKMKDWKAAIRTWEAKEPKKALEENKDGRIVGSKPTRREDFY